MTLTSVRRSINIIKKIIQENHWYFRGTIVEEDEGDFDRILMRIDQGQFQVHLGQLVKYIEEKTGFTLSWIERYDRQYLFWIRFVRNDMYHGHPSGFPR